MQSWLSAKCFQFIHGRNLVYNSCWEDPRIDRAALRISADDNVVVITSAGCNALDYVLAGARSVHAVDINPRQNALLELKLAGIRGLSFDRFFEMFGTGRLTGHEQAYQRQLRPFLSPAARGYWDRRFNFFSSGRGRRGFYFHGSAGAFARMINLYIDRRRSLREAIDRLLASPSFAEQQEIYRREVQPFFWTRMLRWFMRRDLTLAMLGVPEAQRRQVEHCYEGSICRFVEECLEWVFGKIPIQDNYFWRVYLTGAYTPACCPEYLRRANFEALKEELWRRISVHTCTLEDFLRRPGEPITKFVLLDHMDWLASAHRDLLASEWQALADRAAAGARIIFRSGGLYVDYVDPIKVRARGRTVLLGDVLRYHHDLANELHKQDRVHTYGSFYVADLETA